MDKEYTTSGERGTATRLVRAAIAAGYTVSVYDGEEYPVKRSRKERQILAALASTEEDWLVIRDVGLRMGAISLMCLTSQAAPISGCWMSSQVKSGS